MKNQAKLFGLLILFVIIGVSSCKKDENKDTTTKSTRDYLVSGNWKTTAITVSPGINFGTTVITDFFAQEDDCQKDDLTKFNADGTITDDEGATKCDPNDPQTTNDGTWILSADGKSVTIDYPNEDPMTIVITSINDKTLTGSYTLEEDFGSGPLTYTFTITMSH